MVTMVINTCISDILMDVLVGSLAPLVKEDFIWCRISERIITGVPDRCLESVLLPLIDKIPWYVIILIYCPFTYHLYF